MRVLSCFFVSCVGLGACQSPDTQTIAHSPSRAPIYYGQASPSDNAVVALLSDDEAFCTGTLITPTVVLTAAHCLEGEFANNVDVGFGPQSENPTATRSAARLAIHPDYSWQLNADIGLVELSSAAPASITPIAYLPQNLGLSNADLGEPLRFVGYGYDEDDGYGVRLQWTGALGALCSSSQGCQWGGEDLVNSSLAYNQSTGGPCQGDSGGPAFITRDETTYVAGITSYGQDCLGTGVSTWVDRYQNFIELFIGGEDLSGCADAGCYTGAPCTRDSDCGAYGDCFRESQEPDFVGGYCSASCASDADCSGDGICIDFGWSNSCLDACEQDSECRQGYACDEGTCWPLPAGMGESPSGGACNVTAECSVAGSYCYSEVSDGYEDGLCTKECNSDGACGAGAHCSEGWCLASCQRNSDCRAGFTCWPEPDEPTQGACWVSCLSDSEICGSLACNSFGLCGDDVPPDPTDPDPTDPDPTKPTASPRRPRSAPKDGCAAVTPVDGAWLLLLALGRRRKRA